MNLEQKIDEILNILHTLVKESKTSTVENLDGIKAIFTERQHYLTYCDIIHTKNVRRILNEKGYKFSPVMAGRKMAECGYVCHSVVADGATQKFWIVRNFEKYEYDTSRTLYSEMKKKVAALGILMKYPHMDNAISILGEELAEEFISKFGGFI